MIAEFGAFFLFIALIFSFLGLILPIFLIIFKKTPYINLTNNITIHLISFSLSISFSLLIYGFVISDFSILNVYLNSHRLEPLLYRITASWGSHEGSILLFTLLLALATSLFSKNAFFIKYNSNNKDNAHDKSSAALINSTKQLTKNNQHQIIQTQTIQNKNIHQDQARLDQIEPKQTNLQQIKTQQITQYQALIFYIQIIILSFFVSYIYFTSNPFVSLKHLPLEGQGFNPILQDIILAIHPPILYIGYVLLSIGFSIAMSLLIIPTEQKRQIFAILKIITSYAFIFLTAGIALGSFWAYRELGWGGYWFWDPVENSALMPWLITSALLHSAIASYKTGKINRWTIFLGLFAFILSLVGLFLVRSGILTSVHSFANDAERGIYILSFISFVIIPAFLTYILKVHKIENITNNMPTNMTDSNSYNITGNVITGNIGNTRVNNGVNTTSNIASNETHKKSSKITFFSTHRLYYFE